MKAEEKALQSGYRRREHREELIAAEETSGL